MKYCFQRLTISIFNLVRLHAGREEGRRKEGEGKRRRQGQGREGRQEGGEQRAAGARRAQEDRPPPEVFWPAPVGHFWELPGTLRTLKMGDFSELLRHRRKGGKDR